MRVIFYLAIIGCLSACGTTLPPLTNNNQDQLYVEDVHRAIRCEIVGAIAEAYEQAYTIGKIEQSKVDFFEKWGVKYTLTLNVVEDSSFNPTLNLLSPTTPAEMLDPGDSVFTLESGLTFSAKATRTETDQVFHTVSFLNNQNTCVGSTTTNKPIFGNSIGVQPWLTTRLGLVQSRLIASISDKESFTYQVKFEIGKRGNVTPKWAFVKRTLKDGSFISGAGRASSHSVLITFGPVDDTRRGLAETAEAIHTARLIGQAINQ
ncbi:hypothetical protein [Hellea balneolensis]|uniref:hypothetical protein n=1 Tax=Hellea balneolensis TaxID=287478 RepID=UPI00047C143F|nr:hypothetical protein [Hellea balneolensis]